MATITSILPSILAGVDIVGAEPCGLISAVGKDINGEMAAKGQVIRSAISGAETAQDSAPSATQNSGATSVTAVDITITKDRMVPVTLTGDEEAGLAGVANSVLSRRFAQAFRTLRNEIETDLAALYSAGTITAIGTAGTTPFASLADLAAVRKALVKSGAPNDGGYRLVCDPSAYANLLQLSPVVANAAASFNSGAALGEGKIPMIYNMGILESNAIKTVTGTPNYQANMFLHGSAVQLVARMPKYNTAGDAAVDRTVVVDPVTGLSFTIAAYPQHRQMTYEVGIAWGAGVIRPEFLGVLKG